MLRISRRTFGLGAATAAVGSRCSIASAQDDCSSWRGETFQIMAPAKPGGGWDTTARELQRVLQETGVIKTVEVYNVAGAGGTTGLVQLANSNKGDSHQSMIMGLVMIGGIALNKSDIGLDKTTPIARLATEWEVIVVPKDSPMQSMADLVDAMKKDVGGVSWAGGSAGGTDHLLVGMIAKAVGADTSKINYVPYSGGGEALSAILGGQTTAGVSGLGEWQSQIESGELRALAVSGRSGDASASPAASPAAAGFGGDIPTLKESGVDVELANWRGIVAPPELSDEDKGCMAKAIEEAVQSQPWKDTLAKFGWTDYFAGPDEFKTFIESETERVNGILGDLGLA